MLLFLVSVSNSRATTPGLTVFDPPQIEGQYVSAPIVKNTKFFVKGVLLLVVTFGILISD